MKKRRAPRPTESELAILRVLWRRGPSSVRDVHQALSASREMGYTTVLKFLQIMTEKGHVVRDTTSRSHVFSPARPERETLRDLVRELLDKVFAGSAEKLMLAVLDGDPSEEELRKAEDLLATRAGGQRRARR